MNVKVADLELGVSKSAVNVFYRKRKVNNIKNSTNSFFRGCCNRLHRGNIDGGGGDMGGRASYIGDNIRESINNALAMLDPIEEAEHFLANWAAPEFIESGAYTQSSDIYSLGLVLWEIISKKIPFDNETNQDNLRMKVLTLCCIVI